MTEKVKHAPLPWIQVALHPRHILSGTQISREAFRLEPEPAPGGYSMVERLAMCEANAALAVRSVNGLPEALAALEMLAAAVEAHGACSPHDPDRNSLIAALEVATRTAKAIVAKHRSAER